MIRRTMICTVVALLSALVLGRAAVVIDTSIGNGPPPSSFGGYAMTGFPSDPRPLGSWVMDASPPASVPVSGSLVFSDPVQLYDVGPAVGQWNGWSHGYGGQVYWSPWTGAGGSSYAQLDLTLPAGTMAFYLYLEPEVAAATWDFDVRGLTVGGEAIATLLSISGGGGASFVGFYSTLASDPLYSVSVRQNSEEYLGFGIGEFGIHGYVIPEPGAGGLLTGLGLLGAALLRRARRVPHCAD
ncbi:MAG: hypothetical protein KA191_02005 [Verrucomicrobia bacterium]|nr:hypothetical protein [Verrucomicrobiota bacterium]OQC65481.1 MAG: hypothetical protein BWX48_02393 [Verrucomicrobia bacterium ADurb.Bin006]MDI9381896.1 hypothetical protein [Verrucomicrobiota bacterium]NMD20474.1 hypothetical protein [Verrucomicrobiota bacterium]HOA61066.1 hypothetical protein [Verrucomicrobiota bacterium]